MHAGSVLTYIYKKNSLSNLGCSRSKGKQRYWCSKLLVSCLRSYLLGEAKQACSRRHDLMLPSFIFHCKLSSFARQASFHWKPIVAYKYEVLGCIVLHPSPHSQASIGSNPDHYNLRTTAAKMSSSNSVVKAFMLMVNRHRAHMMAEEEEMDEMMAHTHTLEIEEGERR
jgi:hypothetical protein